MNVEKFFEGFERAVFSPIEHAAEAIVHFGEREFNMLTDDFKSLLDGIKAALGRASNNKDADAQTIKDLQAANDSLKSQLSDATQQRDGAVSQAQSLQSQLTDTQQQLSDAKDQLTALLSAAEALAPDPAVQ